MRDAKMCIFSFPSIKNTEKQEILKCEYKSLNRRENVKNVNERDSIRWDEELMSNVSVLK